MSSQSEGAKESTMEYLGIVWQLQSFTGWGVFGINLALQLVKKKLTQPVPLMKPGNVSLDPDDLRLLKPTFEAHRYFESLLQKNPGKVAQLSFPVLHALGNNLIISAESDLIQGHPDMGMIDCA